MSTRLSETSPNPQTAPLQGVNAATVPVRSGPWPQVPLAPLAALALLALAAPFALRATPRPPASIVEETIEPERLAGLWPVRAAHVIGPTLYVDLDGCDSLSSTRRQGLGEFFLLQLGRSGVTGARLHCGGQTYNVELRRLDEVIP